VGGSEFDAIFHFGPGNKEMRKIQKERGLRGAIQWYEENSGRLLRLVRPQWQGTKTSGTQDYK
jgi:hypothetical protein